MPMNPAVWFEIHVQDMARAQAFYESVLQLTLEPLTNPATLNQEIEMRAFPMTMGVMGATGALVKMDGFSSGANSTLVYFHCEDCAVEAGRVAAAGGCVQREKVSLGEYGFMALAVDTEGNMFGLHSMA